MAALAATELMVPLVAVALMAVLTAAVAALTEACCFGFDSVSDLGSWASRGTLGLAWTLSVRVGSVGSGFASRQGLGLTWGL